MKDLTAARIVELHRYAIEQHGGDGTLKANQLELVQAKLDAALQGAVYLDRNDDPLVVSALLLKYFARSQVFVDGNKRVAWASALDILLRCGTTVACTEEDAAEFVLRVAESKSLTDESVVEWLAVRLVDSFGCREQSKIGR